MVRPIRQVCFFNGPSLALGSEMGHSIARWSQKCVGAESVLKWVRSVPHTLSINEAVALWTQDRRRTGGLSLPERVLLLPDA
jgi:hypothetical protein